MPQREKITYGEGGWKPDEPGENIVAREWIVVPDVPPTPEERVAAIEDALAATGNEALLEALAADPRSGVEG